MDRAAARQEIRRDGPERSCVVSREVKPADDLIRFVVGPDGVLTPDIRRKLPGRGVWVEGRRESLAAAVRRKVFARSLRRQVAVPEDLPDRVERLMTRRLAEAVTLRKGYVFV